MADIPIVCENCQQEFVFTEGEQDFYRNKGLEQPKLCMICRARKQAEERDKAQYKKGLTMIELLIVVAILAILIILGLMSWGTQVSKARDAKRKDDINRIKIAFEDYYNDNECYPPKEMLENCHSKDLHPYLAFIPCDPVTDEPYLYEPESNCGGYQVAAVLENEACLRVASGVELSISCGSTATPTPQSTSTPTPTAGPTSTPIPPGGPTPTPWGRFACDPNGQCNVYANPQGAGCPVSYNDSTACQNGCDASRDNWCRQ